MLYPQDFLIKLCTQQHQTKYARITALDYNDVPLESFEGKITSGGPVSLDGASALRRTCSLSLVTDTPTVRATEGAAALTNSYWTYNSKFKLEIGLLNTIDSKYDKIIWFDQGVYLINQFNTSENNSTINININGIDKMARLNGTLGGMFQTTTTLDTEEIVNKDGSVKYEKQLIYNIIRNIVHEIGHEPYHNIIIEDLPEIGYELWNYVGVGSKGEEMPLYILHEETDKGLILRNFTLKGNTMVVRKSSEYNDYTTTEIVFSTDDDTHSSLLEEADGYLYTYIVDQDKYFTLNDLQERDLYHPKKESLSHFNLVERDGDGVSDYVIQRINAGEAAGYHRTGLVYPGDLIANSGETVVSVLDKIKSVLGNFEYFYDVKGRFIFRQKKDYVKGLFTPINGDTMDAFTQISQHSYDFNSRDLLVSVSKNPKLDIKNDFTIWGNRRSSASDDKLPIHARYAIDVKPTKYRTLPNYKRAWITYLSFEEVKYDEENKKWSLQKNQEIYERVGNNFIIAKDKDVEKTYYYLTQEVDSNKATDKILYIEKDKEFFVNTITDFYIKNEYHHFVKDEEFAAGAKITKEYYYLNDPERLVTSSHYDWRELIYLMARDYYQHHEADDYPIRLAEAQKEKPATDGKEAEGPGLDLSANNMTGYEQYYADMQGFWRILYNPEATSEDYVKIGDSEYDQFKYWSRKVLYSPETLDFWIDFLDVSGPLMNYSVPAIGHRPFVENDQTSGVTAIFYKEVPDIEFVVKPYESINNDSTNTKIPMIIQDNMKGLFNISSRGKSSDIRADELIYQHALMSEGLTINCVPLYFLEPNTRIKFFGEDYIINKIQIPVAYNGTMTINATKYVMPL